MSQNTEIRTGWLKRFAWHHPVLLSTLIFIVSALLVGDWLQGPLTPWLGQEYAGLAGVTVLHTVTGLLLLWLVFKLDLFQTAGFTPPRQWRAVWLVWPFALFVLLNLQDVLEGRLVIDVSRPLKIVLMTALALSIGFCEEVLGRSLALMLMVRKWGRSRRGLYWAVLVSSILFGVSHLSNLLLDHRPLLAVVTQIAYGFFFGVAFAACFLRNHTIWPVLLMHAAIDFAGGLRHISVGGAEAVPVANSTPAQAAITILLTLPLLVYGLIVLRKAPALEKDSWTVDTAATQPGS